MSTFIFLFKGDRADTVIVDKDDGTIKTMMRRCSKGILEPAVGIEPTTC